MIAIFFKFFVRVSQGCTLNLPPVPFSVSLQFNTLEMMLL